MASSRPQRQVRRSAKASSTSSRKKGGSGRGSASGLALPTPERLSREARAQEARWRAESDLRTLREAEQIRADRRRLRSATQMAAAEMRALQAVQQRNGAKA
jgi:hypothetical protein